MGYLDEKYTIIGEVTEGLDTLMKINKAYVDENHRPYVNTRIKHIYILHDPFDDTVGLVELVPNQSPKLQKVNETGDELVRLEVKVLPILNKDYGIGFSTGIEICSL